MKHAGLLGAALGLTLLTACPGSIRGHCETSDQCDSGLVCNTELQLCFKPDPSFTLKAARADKRVIRGEALKISVEVERQGLTERIALSLEGLPEFVTAAPVQIGEGQMTGELTVTSNLNAAPGKVDATLVAVAGDKRQTLPVSFELRFPPGSLDGSFGKAGVVGEQGEAVSSARWNVVRLTENREVLLAGGSDSLKLRLALLDPKGRPVLSFNAGAPLTLDEFGEAFAVNTSRPDRFLVLGGSAPGSQSHLRWVGRDGVSQTVHGLPSYEPRLADLTVLSNGGVFIATAFEILRLLPNGEPDSALGPEGSRSVEWSPPSSGGYKLFTAGPALRLRDGSTLHANTGSGLDMNTSVESRGAFLTRLKEDHRVDRAFGTEGVIASHAKGRAPDIGFAALLEAADGKIISAGSRPEGAAVFRFLPTGALDTSFGQNGVALLSLKDSAPLALAQQSDGKLLVAGATTGRAFLTRLNPDGSIDLAFGDKGTVFSFNDSKHMNAKWVSMVLDGDDGILVAGQAGDPYDKRFALVARFFQ